MGVGECSLGEDGVHASHRLGNTTFPDRRDPRLDFEARMFASLQAVFYAITRGCYITYTPIDRKNVSESIGTYH